MNEHDEIRRLQHQAKFNVNDHISDMEETFVSKIDTPEFSNLLLDMIDIPEIDGECLSEVIGILAHRQAILSAKIKIKNDNQAEIDQADY